MTGAGKIAGDSAAAGAIMHKATSDVRSRQWTAERFPATCKLAMGLPSSADYGIQSRRANCVHVRETQGQKVFSMTASGISNKSQSHSIGLPQQGSGNGSPAVLPRVSPGLLAPSGTFAKTNYHTFYQKTVSPKLGPGGDLHGLNNLHFLNPQEYRTTWYNYLTKSRKSENDRKLDLLASAKIDPVYFAEICSRPSAKVVEAAKAKGWAQLKEKLAQDYKTVSADDAAQVQDSPTQDTTTHDPKTLKSGPTIESQFSLRQWYSVKCAAAPLGLRNSWNPVRWIAHFVTNNIAIEVLAASGMNTKHASPDHKAETQPLVPLEYFQSHTVGENSIISIILNNKGQITISSPAGGKNKKVVNFIPDDMKGDAKQVKAFAKFMDETGVAQVQGAMTKPGLENECSFEDYIALEKLDANALKTWTFIPRVLNWFRSAATIHEARVNSLKQRGLSTAYAEEMLIQENGSLAEIVKRHKITARKETMALAYAKFRASDEFMYYISQLIDPAQIADKIGFHFTSNFMRAEGGTRGVEHIDGAARMPNDGEVHKDLLTAKLGLMMGRGNEAEVAAGNALSKRADNYDRYLVACAKDPLAIKMSGLPNQKPRALEKLSVEQLLQRLAAIEVRTDTGKRLAPLVAFDVLLPKNDSKKAKKVVKQSANDSIQTRKYTSQNRYS
ncbi:hypothetical protein, partial [Rhizobium sp. PDO1-076]|uniref:hypothetical protein n=1 Tax=Rhizobium sp. PDO1-076 TaxID=1125979 RepID=UPI001147107F